MNRQIKVFVTFMSVQVNILYNFMLPGRKDGGESKVKDDFSDY